MDSPRNHYAKTEDGVRIDCLRRRIDRRAFLRGAAAYGLAAAGLAGGVPITAACSRSSSSEAQGRTWRIGFLSTGRDSGIEDPYRTALSRLGYDDAHTVIERRFTESRQDLLETYSNELAGLDLDVLVVVSAPALFYVRQWRNEVPIVAVMPLVDDVAAIGAGYSLARPGANITGLIGSVPGLWGKRFELLQEVVPRTSRVALLWNSLRMQPVSGFAGLSDAQSLGMTLLPQEVANTDELEQAFEAAVAARADALAWFATVLISDDHARIARLALESGLASISDQRQFVNAGGLMAYSGDLSDWPQRTAALVDRVLKGQKPAEIAIEGPSRFILSVNLGTARALGIKFPQSVLLRATEVIQ